MSLTPALWHFTPVPARWIVLPMAYVQIEVDEATVHAFNTPSLSFHPQKIEGPERLQFHCTRQSPPRPLGCSWCRCSLAGLWERFEQAEGRERPRLSDLNILTYLMLMPTGVSGCKHQKRVLEARALPTILRRGYIHGQPVFQIPSVSIPTFRPGPQTLLTLLPWSSSYLSFFSSLVHSIVS